MKNKYPFIQTIRYMGNKSKLLDFIIPEIEALTNEGDTVCDIMAGTNAIGYALKRRNVIISNDIQYYSFVIARFLLSNHKIPKLEKIHEDIDCYYKENIDKKYFNFFIENYTDTYFSYDQCLDIDSLRYAIDKQTDEFRKNYYLTLLMCAMCKAQSTSGHFAQFMNKSNKRIAELRKKSIYELFFSKTKDFDNFLVSKYDSINLNLDYKKMFELNCMDDVKCFYLDSPYTSDQYSRFYHILETVCKYDNPTLHFKAKYRDDRVMSDFCYKNKVADEFENIIKFCKSKNASLVISYSNHGVISVDEIVDIAKKFYKRVQCKYINYNHSSQGNGPININEVILVLEANHD